MASNTRIFAFSLCFIAMSSPAFIAQEAFSYREFQLGTGLASIVKLTGAAPSNAKTIHSRPAMMQDLEWRPRYSASGVSSLTDPVGTMLFRFYDDQLFSIVVDYDRKKTEGMSAADMVGAISEIYGPVTQVPSRRLGSATVPYGYPDTPLGVWGTGDYSLTLFSVAYPESFRLVIALTRLEDLARVASAAAVRMDKDEAPQRELDRQKKEATDAAAAKEKAKTENKAQFKP